MRRFFVEEMKPDAETIEITGGEFVHLKGVLRLGKGDAVAVFDGNGVELAGFIEAIGIDRAMVRVEGRAESSRESPVRLVLIQALPKGEKTDLIIQKATELGASEVRFYASKRAVPKVASEKEAAKTQRWRKIAIEAAKQCGRCVVPATAFFKDLVSASTGLEGAMKLALWENEKATGISEAIKGKTDKSVVAVLVGPEGGLPNEEVDDARRMGFTAVKFGPRILRAETAAIAALAVLQHAIGDLK